MLTLIAFAALAQEPPMRPRRLPDTVEVVKNVEYGRAGAKRLLLDVYRLKEKPSKRMPAVIFIHGGGWRGGSKDMGNPTVPALAERGFVSFSIDYRLMPEAGFSEIIGDCKTAVRWVRDHARDYGLDPNRIGVWGTSAGGHLASMLGTSHGVREVDGGGRTSTRVQAVVSCYGPTDMLNLRKQRPGGGGRAEERLVGGPLSEANEKARIASPVTWVSRDDPPFLFLHGEADRVVPVEQSRNMHAALLKAGVRSEIQTFPGVGHRLTPEGRRRIVEFFVRELRP